MRNQMNNQYIAGSSALKFEYLEGEATPIIDFPRIHSTRGQHVRRSSLAEKTQRKIGEENYRNLMGAETVLTKMQLAFGGAVLLAGGMFLVVLESLI